MPKSKTDYGTSESLTVSGTAGGFTTATIAGKQSAIITCEVAVVRFWLDGSTPTATAGHELFPGDVLKLDSFVTMTDASFIRRNGTSATLRCSYGD